MMPLRLAAKRTGLSSTTLRRYIKSSRLRARLIPGRYGPEYVVSEEDLAAAGVSMRRDDAAALEREPVSTLSTTVATPGMIDTTASSRELAPTAGSRDAVPGMLYRELLMKHEQLLVRYGMLRVSGQQLYEVRKEAERRATEARAAAEALQRVRDRHAREIGQLRANLRQAELRIADKDDRIRDLDGKLRQIEIRLRNAETLSSIDSQFADIVPQSEDAGERVPDGDRRDSEPGEPESRAPTDH